jgi:hypothetical protein
VRGGQVNESRGVNDVSRSLCFESSQLHLAQSKALKTTVGVGKVRKEAPSIISAATLRLDLKKL